MKKSFEHNKEETCGLCKKEIDTSKNKWVSVIDFERQKNIKTKFYHRSCLDDFLVRNFAYFNYKSYVKRLCLKGNEKVLEIGCGGGNLSRFLAEKGKELVCIDNSKYWIEKAKKRLNKFKNIKFEIFDILDFNKKNYLNYFDAAIMHYVLHDFVNREKTIEILRKCLKEDGKICIREPTRESHGIPSEEIVNLMARQGFLEMFVSEKYSFPLRGKIYEAVFKQN